MKTQLACLYQIPDCARFEYVYLPSKTDSHVGLFDLANMSALNHYPELQHKTHGVNKFCFALLEVQIPAGYMFYNALHTKKKKKKTFFLKKKNIPKGFRVRFVSLINVSI